MPSIAPPKDEDEDEELLRLQSACVLRARSSKIDLRGGGVTHEALEEEIMPIMNVLKVRVQLLDRTGRVG